MDALMYGLEPKLQFPAGMNEVCVNLPDRLDRAGKDQIGQEWTGKDQTRQTGTDMHVYRYQDIL